MSNTSLIKEDAPDVLKRILSRKLEDLTALASECSLAAVSAQAEQADAPRGFADALERHAQSGRAGIIAEVKKASPSKGVIREHFVPEEIARSYASGGASALSVLTDEPFFQGHRDYLVAARAASGLPVLRKDFVIDEYQIYEARAMGADCVLLIVAALGDAQLAELNGLAHHLGMDVLIEVHDREELDRALQLRPRLLGINNRDLRTFETSLSTTLDLLPHIGNGCILVTESAIHTHADIALMREHGVNHFLVGEAFMRAEEPGEKMRELFDLG